MKKFFSFFISVLLLFSIVSCTTPQVECPITSTDDTQKNQSPEGYEEQKNLYDDILTQYTSLLTAKKNGENIPIPNTADMSQREVAISETLYDIINGCKNAQSAENLGYGYKDFDGNGIPELIILTKYRSIYAIFTISDGAPVLLEANYGARSSFVFATKNRFFMVRDNVNGNIEETTFYTCHVEGDKMVYDTIYGKVYDQSEKKTLEIFQIKDGKRTQINEDTFNELYREYKKATVPGYSTTSKLLAPRIYFPLKDNATSENLPIADFSSYSAIRETYKKISTCLDEFDSAKWEFGEYDNLFAFPNDLSFEYYTRLLYAAYHGAYGIGYDEIDLNGDGKDELVLVNEDYRIKAIFTQKGGTPVLLDAFAYETCWLDDEGFIHVDNEQYYELEYNLYEFTSDGEYNLIYSILVAENGNRYLTKDGKTEKITFEKSLELYYDDYCRYSEPFEPYEQTRNVSDLTYTPLISPTGDVISTAVAQTWHKYANLEKTSDKEFARSNTYVTFENVTETQMTMSLKYVFTFSYPDPDRDHYLLDDSTESILKITVRNENGMFVFDENGIKGKIEFGHKYMWFVIDESTDPRFPIGNHRYEKYVPVDLIS
ncbi:MAG: hypothetical protein IKB75_00935 [Clostridia bacterium]|nr:hypothetical protein [Clostridia bacterium]